MRGVGRMVVAIASAVLTMACQGCVAVSPHDQMRIEPAVPPTVGMMMAAPGTSPVVTPITQDESRAREIAKKNMAVRKIIDERKLICKAKIIYKKYDL